MKSKLLFLLALLLSVGVYAQKNKLPFTIIDGKEFKKNRRMAPPVFIGSANNVFYFSTVKVQVIPILFIPIIKTKWYIQEFDTKLNLLNETKLFDEKDKKLKLTPYAFTMREGDISTIVGAWNKKGKKYDYTLRTIDRRRMTFVGKPTRLFKSKNTPEVITSLNGEKTALIVDESQAKLSLFKKDRSKEKILATVVDMKEGVEWSGNLDLSYEDRLFVWGLSDVDNNGNVHISGKLYDEKKKESKKVKSSGGGKKKKVSNYTYNVLSYMGGPEQLSEFEVKLGDLYISDFGFFADNDNNLIMTGFYSDERSSRAQGVFTIKVDPTTNEIISSGSSDFPPKFIGDAQFKSIFGKKRDELSSFEITHMVEKANGNVVIFAEQFYVTVHTSTTRSSTGATTSRTTYSHHFNHVIAVEMDVEGEIVWANIIPKTQAVSLSSPFSSGFLRKAYPYISFNVLTHGNDISMLYNISEKNLNVKRVDDMKACFLCKQVSAVTTFDDEGKAKRVIYNSGEDEKKWFVLPGRTYQVNDDTYITAMQKKKRYKLQILKF